MANLLEVFELVWSNLNRNGSKQSDLKKEEVIAKGLTEYAAAMYIFTKEEDDFQLPSQMITTVVLPVKDNIMDITGLNILDSLPNDGGIINIGGLGTRYVKSTFSNELALRDDDSLGPTSRPYYRTARKIIFPGGTHAKNLSFTYASIGPDVDPRMIEANDYVASKVSEKLMQFYGINVQADHTENSNSNN